MLVELEDSSGRTTAVAIEADTGTEGPTVVAKKLARYEGYRRSNLPLYGLDVDVVLLAAPTDRRLRSLARAVPHMSSISIRFLNFATASPETLFASAVRKTDAILHASGDS